MSELTPSTSPGSASPGAATTAEFWFDPICPFTWRTSRWLVDVAGQRDLAVTWRVMSLSVLKTGSVFPTPGKAPEHLEGRLREGASALRVLVAAEDAGGQEAVGKLYMLLGSRKHDGDQPYTPEVLRQAVLDAGLPDSVADAASDESFDARIAASHEQGQQRGGTEMGSPILALGSGRGYFGPVVTDIPDSDDALRLFDGVQLLASVPVFSEFKTSRS